MCRKTSPPNLMNFEHPSNKWNYWKHWPAHISNHLIKLVEMCDRQASAESAQFSYNLFPQYICQFVGHSGHSAPWDTNAFRGRLEIRLWMVTKRQRSMIMCKSKCNINVGHYLCAFQQWSPWKPWSVTNDSTNNVHL